MSYSLETALKHRVVLLTGEEALRRRALSELLAHVAPENDDFDLQHFEAGSSSPVDWLGSAGTAPFLSPRRTVVVRQLLRHEPDPAEWAAIGTSMQTLPDYALLVLVADEESGDEDKLRRFARVQQGWDKAVKGAGGLLGKFESNAKAINEAIKAEVARLGKKITAPAAQILAEMSGGSLSRCIEELEKVALFIGSEETIREDAIREIVVPSREWNVFQLVDAATSGDVASALKQLRILVGSATKAEEAAYGRVFPMVSRQLKLLWQARVCVEAGCDPTSVPPAVAALFPSKPNLTKESPFVQGKVMRSARNVTLDQLTVCMSLLSDADARLKGMLPSFSAMETLEHMILDMAAAVRKPEIRVRPTAYQA